MQIWLNGKPASEIDILDRGLQYGDGLFETMRVMNGEIPLWSHHWQRLSQSCTRLSLPVPDQIELQQEITACISDERQALLKLIITRGRGDRGYVMPEHPRPSRILMLSGAPDHPDHYQKEGIRVYACQLRLGINPALAGIKHLNRLEQVMARQEWQTGDYQEGMLCDTKGHLIEGTMSNLFWVKQGQLYTPELTGCGVAGVMREVVMQLASQNNISLKMGLWPADELVDAEEIFMTNSLIGIWPVSYILDRTLHVGPVTQQFQQMLQANYAI